MAVRPSESEAPLGGSTPPMSRRRGRPRQADMRMRILEAAIEELCSVGPAGLTFDGLAARAGVAKATIYRRWVRKVDVIIDAIDRLREHTSMPDTGNVRADLEIGLDNIMTVFASPRSAAVAAVVSERLRDPDLAAAWEEKFQKPNREAFAAVLRRGVADGQVKLALSVEETAEFLSGAAFMVLMGFLPWRPGLAAGVVSTILDGIDAATEGALSRPR